MNLEEKLEGLHIDGEMKQEEKQKIAIIVDANAFIKQIAIREIINQSLKTQEEFEKMYEVYTLNEVIQEIKDQKTRQFIENLPYKVTIASASTLVDQKDLQVVEDFARETGDLQTLSKVDKLVIAAGISLAKQKNEFSKVKMQPADLKEFRPKAFKDYYEDPTDKYFSSDEEQEESQQKNKDVKNFDEFEESYAGKKGRRAKDELRLINNSLQDEKQKKKIEKAKQFLMSDEEEEEVNEQKNDEDKKQEQVEVQKDQITEKTKQDSSQDSDEFDNEEEGGQWVTSKNIHLHLNGGVDARNLMENDDNFLFDQEKSQSKQSETSIQENKNQQNKLQSDIKYVKFITSDFAMQNVIIQMGFQMLTLDGLRLTRVKRFKLLCKGCHMLQIETERMFCKQCGGAFLTKVSVYINNNGEVTYFNNPRRKVNLRGTKYSIPDQKGGRGCQDLVLREDDLQKGEYKQLVQKIEKMKKQELMAINDTLEGNYWTGGQGYGLGGAAVSNLLYENGAKGGKTSSKRAAAIEKIQVGYGRKNPNIAKKKF